MNLGAAIRSTLMADSEVFAAVADRIRPDELAQGDSFPAVLIEIEEEDPLAMLSQAGGLQKAKVLISVFAATKAESRSIARRVRTALESEGGFEVEGLEIDLTFEGRKNGFSADDDGADTGIYFSENEFEVWFEESGES